VVYLSADESSLPKINIDIDTPWEQGHGTCIQMCLKKNITPIQIANFLLRNVLRTSSKIDVIIDDDHFILQPRWHFVQMDEYNFWNVRLFESRSDLDEIENTEDLFNEFYKNTDFYSNPPRDKGLTSEIFFSGVKGFIYLTPYDHQLWTNRITQNGILIENANEYIDGFIPELFNIDGSAVATYDLNIEGNSLFDLDAERVRILESDLNKDIVDLFRTPLIHGIIGRISKIEHTLYFPCGSIWYHEIGLTDMENCQPAFHKALNIFLRSLTLLNEHEQRLAFGAFGKAKLYCLLQGKSNLAISANEIINNEKFALMIPKNKDIHVENAFGFDERRCIPHDILNYSEPHGLKAVMMPNHLEAFSFPLLDRVELKTIVDNKHFIGYSLCSSNASDSYMKNLNKIYSDVAPKRKRSNVKYIGSRDHFIDVVSSNTTLVEDINLLNEFLSER